MVYRSIFADLRFLNTQDLEIRTTGEDGLEKISTQSSQHSRLNFGEDEKSIVTKEDGNVEKDKKSIVIR